MPASEKTWRDQKTLHVVFGCTGLLMLFATVWMFQADHSRQWKKYQRKMRNIDVRLTGWRMQSERSQENMQQRQELTDSLEQVESAPPLQAPFDNFVDAVAAQDPDQAESLRSLYSLLASDSTSEAERMRKRRQLDDQMAELVSLARFKEDNLLSRRKFKAADYDEKRAVFDLGVRDNLPAERLAQLQAEVDREKQSRDELTLAYQDAADYRKQLDAAMRQTWEPRDEIKKQISNLEAEYDRLSTSLEERKATYFTSRPPFLGKRWLELPVLDAFNSPLKIDNLWTQNLTIINGSFGAVRRFDRCTTCHKAIQSTAPGSAVDPLYDTAEVLEFLLTTPEERPTAASVEGDGDAQVVGVSDTRPSLLSIYGMGLAETGLVNANDVPIRQIMPESLAATAQLVGRDGEDGLKVGDVLLYIRESKVLSADQAERYLLEQMEWGKPVRLQVLRGLPQPYSSHPRLDLFVGSLSPHKSNIFGCTVCHEGQGSATDFEWASHTPNDPEQQDEWVKEHGWFNNHHWIYPMYPARFAESSCLKCHHEVVELEIAQYDEPPAPKLTHGYHLVRQYGCFGCHEINGYNGPNNRIGPDMRLEPNYSAAASQLRSDDGFGELTEEQQSWIEQLIQHPERTEVRHQLLRFLKQDAAEGDDATLVSARPMIPALDDVESPGNLRKVGPSLRHLGYKMGPSWLYDWLRDPTHFRASTRMPRFFGMWDHLDSEERAVSEAYEPIEILGIVRYLLSQSQDVELLHPGDGAIGDSDEQLARGKLLFETRGCLACHQHVDFPNAHATQGPNLSNIGDKLNLEDNPGDVRTWLYSWLKNPSLYHPRTKMPDLYLDPIPSEDGSETDPAADIAAYLLSSSTGWAPKDDTAAYLLHPNEEALNSLVKEHLNTKLYSKDVEAALEANQIPPGIAATLDGAELLLAGAGGMTTEDKLEYVGHKTITKYGCYGCHDIVGFETAKPIGTGLADWGRKDPSKLAFEHIAEYIAHGHGHGDAGHSENDSHAPSDDSDEHGDADSDVDSDVDDEFYVDRLLDHDRSGFIWQKLKEPRSYDFAKARNKDSFNDRLRMPLFPFNETDREAVITFVLGLVAEPPAYEFVYHPTPEKQALIAGHQALTKYNCVGCHVIDPETWTLEIPQGIIEEQPSDPAQTFPFMPHQFTTDEIDVSAEPDPLRGTISVQLTGMPEISSSTGFQRILDEEGDEIEFEERGDYDPATLIYPFELWKPTLIDGHTFQSGVVPIEVEASWIRRRAQTFGGDLTHWLLPRAVEIEREANPQADGKQAYGWLPPPLNSEGNKVQTDWLHSFLLDPFKIRPAVFMRMPKFNMSPSEATDLVNYFAARDRAVYPYEYSNAAQDERLDEANLKYQSEVDDLPASERPEGGSRFDDAMQIVTSSDYCVQCHIVGDFVPKTSNRAMAPDLTVVNRRLRPDYLKRWLANPKQLLPYTPMPVNVKYNADEPNLGGVSQQLYHGTSLQQLSALADLLMNYPRYAKSRAPVAGLVKTGTPPVDAGSPGDPE